jgi:hypothetical protein
MSKSSVDSATGIDTGCVIAFPREKTIGIRGSTSGASLPESSANPSAASDLRPDRTSTVLVDNQADGHLARDPVAIDPFASKPCALAHTRRDANRQNSANQNLMGPQRQVAYGQLAHTCAGLPMMPPATLDQTVAGSQMSLATQMSSRAGTHPAPSRSLETASPAAGTDILRKAAAARLVAVARDGFNPGDANPARVDQSRSGKGIAYPPLDGPLSGIISSSAEISSYIAHMTQELAQMARGSNLDLLAYFLDMAELEARMRSSANLQSA